MNFYIIDGNILLVNIYFLDFLVIYESEVFMKNIIVFLLGFALSFSILTYFHQKKIDENVAYIYSSASNILSQSFYETRNLIENQHDIEGQKLNSIYQNLWQCEVLFSSIRSMNSNVDIDISYLVKYYGSLNKKKVLSSKDLENLNILLDKGVYRNHSGLYEKDTFILPPNISEQYSHSFEVINELCKNILEI